MYAESVLGPEGSVLPGLTWPMADGLGFGGGGSGRGRIRDANREKESKSSGG